MTAYFVVKLEFKYNFIQNVQKYTHLKRESDVVLYRSNTICKMLRGESHLNYNVIKSKGSISRKLSLLSHKIKLKFAKQIVWEQINYLK